MDLRSGYTAILMVYAIFGVFTRNLVHGGNESTTTEGITDLTSTKSVELTTSFGTVQVNISSTATSYLGTSVSSNTSGSIGTSVSTNASGSLGTSDSGTTINSLGTSVSSNTSNVLGTSVSSDASSSIGTSVSSTTLSASGTSISSTTLSAIGTSTLLTTKSSSITTASDAVLFAGTAPVNISSTKFSDLMAADPNITPSASGMSISNTTLSTIGTSTSLTTKSSSTTVASVAVQLTGTTPVNISSTKFSDLMAADPNTTLSASVTSISNTTLSTIGTSTSLTTKSSPTTTTLGTVLQTESLKVLQTSCQDLNTPCMNNGTCTPGGTCLCPSSWTGRRCEYPCFSDGCPSEMNVCIIDRKCNLIGTAYCSNMTDCLCFPGWNGSMCNISVCDNYYCYNGGKCRNNSGNAVCDCVRGATGRHCEHNMEYSCLHMLPVAVDRIISCTDNIGYYTLMCKPEWTGKNCETPINMTEFCISNECDLQHMDYCNAVCERGNCTQKFMALKADGYDDYNSEDQLATYAPTRGCSFTLADPWDMCNISKCIERFADGFCDASCNNEACLFDGYDCIGGKGFLEDCSPYFNTPCSYNLTFDGKCDTECNTTDCLYDGFDCALSGLSPLSGQLVIQVQPVSDKDSILRKIGLLLRSRVNQTFFDTMNDVFVVYLKLTCSGLVNKNCFTSIQSAAKFLAAYVAKRTVPDLLVKDIFDASHSKHEEETPVKTDYTGVIVGVIASVFIIAGAILIAFLCWRRQQSGDYILDEEAGTKTNANLEAVTTVQDQNSHMANFASSKDAVDLDEMHDNSVYAGRSQAAYVMSTDHDELAENSQETTLGINIHSQIQPSVEITLTADLDESNEKFANSGRVDLKLPPPDYTAETRDTDDQSSDDREDVVVRNSGLLVAGGAPLAASEASLLSKDTLDEPPQSDDEPPQPDDQFMFEDGNLPQVTEADFNEGNISDEEEEEKETRKSRSSSSSSSSDNN